MILSLSQLLPSGTEVLEDFLLPQLNLRFDIWVPSRNLAVEYQGEQHFRDVSYVGAKSRSQTWDHAKAAACQKAGIALVEIPFSASMDDIKNTLRPRFAVS